MHMTEIMSESSSTPPNYGDIHSDAMASRPTSMFKPRPKFEFVPQYAHPRDFAFVDSNSLNAYQVPYLDLQEVDDQITRHSTNFSKYSADCVREEIRQTTMAYFEKAFQGGKNLTFLLPQEAEDMSSMPQSPEMRHANKKVEERPVSPSKFTQVVDLEFLEDDDQFFSGVEEAQRQKSKTFIEPTNQGRDREESEDVQEFLAATGDPQSYLNSIFDTHLQFAKPQHSVSFLVIYSAVEVFVL